MGELNDSIEIHVCPDLDDPMDGIKPCTHYVKGGFCTLPNYFRCLEWMVRHEPVLSYSAMSEYTACHRRFYWAYICGIEAIEKSWPLILGTHAAKILGWLHDQRIPPEKAIEKYQLYIKELIEATMVPEEDDEETKWGSPDLWKMKAVFDVYIEKGYLSLRGIPEVGFRWNFEGYPQVKGFIDLKLTTDPSTSEAWEFKYTGNSGNYTKFLIEDQLKTYFLSDPKILKITNRCLCPPGIWKKKGTKTKDPETMLEFFERCKKEVTRNLGESFLDRIYYRHEFDLEEYKEDAKILSIEIINFLKEGKGIRPFYRNKKACLSPFRCDFLKCCENDIKEPWSVIDTFKSRGKKNAIYTTQNQSNV